MRVHASYTDISYAVFMPSRHYSFRPLVYIPRYAIGAEFKEINGASPNIEIADNYGDIWDEGEISFRPLLENVNQETVKYGPLRLMQFDVNANRFKSAG